VAMVSSVPLWRLGRLVASMGMRVNAHRLKEASDGNAGVVDVGCGADGCGGRLFVV
jgi:hypothetical protein